MKEDVTADWLSIESSDNQVTVKVADNTETVERSSRIMIMPTNSESNVDEVYITVTQGAGEPLKPEPIQLKNVGAITYYTPNYLFNTNDNDGTPSRVKPGKATGILKNIRKGPA